jgi:hypothetical protein
VKTPLPIVPFVALGWFVWQWATRSSGIEMLVAGNAMFQIAAAIELAFARVEPRSATLPLPALRAVYVNSAPSDAGA